MDIQDLQRRFAFHTPANAADPQAVGDGHAAVRSTCYEAACSLDALVPDGREKSLAITSLEEAMMWGNAGIARAGQVGPGAQKAAPAIPGADLSHDEACKLVEWLTAGGLESSPAEVIQQFRTETGS